MSKMEDIQVSEKIENSPKNLAILDLPGFLEKLAKKQEAQDKINAELVAQIKLLMEILDILKKNLENPPKPTPPPESEKIGLVFRDMNSNTNVTKAFTAYFNPSSKIKEFRLPIAEKEGIFAYYFSKWDGNYSLHDESTIFDCGLQHGDVIKYST